jgi:hypothetical protein
MLWQTRTNPFANYGSDGPPSRHRLPLVISSAYALAGDPPARAFFSMVATGTSCTTDR